MYESIRKIFLWVEGEYFWPSWQYSTFNFSSCRNFHSFLLLKSLFLLHAFHTFLSRKEYHCKILFKKFQNMSEKRNYRLFEMKNETIVKGLSHFGLFELIEIEILFAQSSYAWVFQWVWIVNGTLNDISILSKWNYGNEYIHTYTLPHCYVCVFFYSFRWIMFVSNVCFISTIYVSRFAR